MIIIIMMMIMMMMTMMMMIIIKKIKIIIIILIIVTDPEIMTLGSRQKNYKKTQHKIKRHQPEYRATVHVEYSLKI